MSERSSAIDISVRVVPELDKEGAREVINSLHDKGWKIIIISFRKDKYLKDPYKLTVDWLNDNGILYDKVFVIIAFA